MLHSNKKNPTVLSGAGFAMFGISNALPADSPAKKEYERKKQQSDRSDGGQQRCLRGAHAAHHVARHTACQLFSFQLLVLLTRVPERV